MAMTEKKESANALEKQQQKPQAVNEPLPVRVKNEKIDAEVEAKLQAIKSESASPPTGTPSESDSNDSLLEDKKQIAPVKSSNELLAELFSVFNAAPPEALLDDKSLLTKHKKSKKEKKKKSRSKHEKSDGECSETDVDSDKHKHKRRKHKHKHKDSKDKHKDKDREKSKEKGTVTNKPDEKTETRKRYAVPLPDKEPVPPKKDSGSVSEKERERNRERERERVRERDRERERERELDRERARGNNSFYNGYHDVKRPRSKEKNARSTKIKLERRQSDELSLSDEETFLREKANGRRSFYGDSKPEPSDSNRNYKSVRQPNSSSARQRSRSRSRSRDLGIDKKRLLEIARRNAISTFKRGNMAGVAKMTPEAKDKVMLKMRYGGRSVQDLTDFCKKISNGEMLSDLSSDEDSDVDKNGNAKAFHHPFQLKEREPIVMHIRNSTPIVPSTLREDQTKAITMQFPVSSGQVHRMSEVWVPVDPLTPLPALPPAKQSTNMFKDVQMNVFAKPLPQQELQEPAFKPTSNLLEAAGTPDRDTSTARMVPASLPPPLLVPPPLPVPPPALSAPLPVPSPSFVATQVPSPKQPQAPNVPFIPEVPIPSSATRPQAAPSASIFPQAQAPSKDVHSIITQRLNAIRRLQDNPADFEAQTMMNNAQKDMSSWASSKFLPGQFTGSTGAQVMKFHELNRGPQLWARPDQLTDNKPVTGGMGMALLQKMGWKPGEGLGRTKTGSLQPLQLTVKLDKRGLISREDIKQHSPRPTGARNVYKNTTAASNIAQAALTAQEKHPVCVLNELTSKNRWMAPQYTLRNDTGPSHSRVFLFSVEINGQSYTPALGCNSKKEAKSNAAKLCLRALGILPPS